MEYKENYLYYDDNNYVNNNQTGYNSVGYSFFPELIVLFFFSYTTAMICRCFKGVCFNNNNNNNNSNNRIYNSDIEARIIPNLSQIDKKTISYEELLNYFNNYDCTICLEEFNNDEEIIKLKCNHLFHSKCIDDWIEKNQSCPLCRINLL